MSTAPGDSDPLAKLSASVRRPPASMSAFSGLSEAQLRLLGDAVDATVTRRQAEIDAELSRVLPQLPRPLVIRLLRGAGHAPLRERLLRRQP